jgi:Family of unknown function (DUF6599)
MKSPSIPLFQRGKFLLPLKKGGREGYRRSCIFSTFPIFLLLTCLLLQPILTKAAERPMDSLFPKPGFSAGWVLDGPIKYYDRDTLFEYINGEAELFYPFGFTRLASAFYKKAGDPKIGLAVDIYQMGSLLETFGIYASFRKRDSDFLKIGSQGFVSPSQLMFYQDRYFIQLSASGTTNLDRPLLEACARMIAKKLPGRPLRPRELSWLDSDFVSPNTTQYVPQSLLGHPFLRRGLIARGQQGGKEFRVFIVWEDSPEKAKKTLESYFSYLKESGVPPQVKATLQKITLSGLDPMYKGAFVALKGRFLAGVVDQENPDQGEPIVDKILSGIPPLK